jgi:uncharacterized membrane protein
MDNLSIDRLVFAFFFFSVTGWVMETIQESIVRRRFVSKGFFLGPYVPVQGIGGIAIYLVCAPLAAWPPLVFLAGMVAATAVEYVTALFLEKCFKVKCWDYTTYPHTKWCHFQGRIALTISLFFGIVSLATVYGYADFIMDVADRLGVIVWPIDFFLVGLFIVDLVFSSVRVFKAHRAGIAIKGYALFSDIKDKA